MCVLPSWPAHVIWPAAIYRRTPDTASLMCLLLNLLYHEDTILAHAMLCRCADRCLSFAAGMAVSEGVQLQSKAASDTASRQVSESKLQGPVSKQRRLAAVKSEAQNSSSMRKRSAAGQKKVTFAGGPDEQSKDAPSKNCTTPHQNAESRHKDKAAKIRPVSAGPVNTEQPPFNVSLVPDTYAEQDEPHYNPDDGIQSLGSQQEGHADEVLSADVGTKDELHSRAGSRQGPRWVEESVPSQSMAPAPQAVPVKHFTRTKLHRVSEPSEPSHQAAECDNDNQPVIPVDADLMSDSMMPNSKRRKQLRSPRQAAVIARGPYSGTTWASAGQSSQSFQLRIRVQWLAELKSARQTSQTSQLRQGVRMQPKLASA